MIIPVVHPFLDMNVLHFRKQFRLCIFILESARANQKDIVRINHWGMMNNDFIIHVYDKNYLSFVFSIVCVTQLSE